MSTALALLKKARGSRGYLYEQPWYVIVGPPGAGKTTALLNSGLKFPLAAEMGQGAVAGVGGTRLCDWWFTENAVLIDTAGRYTTQEFNAAVDRAGWDAFLDLLRRTRPRQPLNGAIVAIRAAASIATTHRPTNASPTRGRYGDGSRSSSARLGIRIPVYALFTKADLDRRLHRILRRPRPGSAQPGVGHDVPAPRAPEGPGAFADEFSCSSTAQHERCTSACRPSGAPSGEPRSPDFRPDRLARASRADLPRAGVRRIEARPCPDAAWRLPHLGHAGGDPDRPVDRRDGAHIRSRAATCDAVRPEGTQLLPRTTGSEVIMDEAHAGERDLAA